MARIWINRPAAALAGGLLLGAGGILAAAWLLGLFGFVTGQSAWVHQLPKSLPTLAAAKLTASHDPVVIDGRETSPQEWDAAARLTFATYGQGIFLWDDQGLYGRVSYSGGQSDQPWAPGINDVDSTCVSVFGQVPVTSGPSTTGPATMPAVKARLDVCRLDLHIVAALRPSAGRSATLKAVNASRNFQPEPVDAGAIRFASHADNRNLTANAGVTPWSCEFFVPWELLGAHGGPPQYAGVTVFRVRQEDPEFTLYIP